jgi:hypothetical protein
MNIARAHGDLACGSYLLLVLVLVRVLGWLSLSSTGSANITIAMTTDTVAYNRLAYTVSTSRRVHIETIELHYHRYC